MLRRAGSRRRNHRRLRIRLCEVSRIGWLIRTHYLAWTVRIFERLVPRSHTAHAARLYSYTTDIPTAIGSQDVHIALSQVSHSAYDSWVSLPAPFNLYVDTAPGRWGDDDIILEWDILARELATIQIDGPCIQRHEVSIDPINDDGIAVIGTGELVANLDWAGFECPIDITVTRSRHGLLDPGLDGGSIVASQVRSQRIYLYE